MNQIVILSGQIGTGKTTLANKLESEFDFCHIKTRDFLRSHCEELQLERAALQALGEKLDRRTGGAWVLEHLEKLSVKLPECRSIVLDSVRHPGQVTALRAAYGRKVIHIHLEADFAELETRYKHRPLTEIKELASYTLAKQNKPERTVNRLSKLADVVIRTDRCAPDDVLVRVASHIGCYGRECLRLVDVL